MTKHIGWAAFAVLVLAGGVWGFSALGRYKVVVPEYQAPRQLVQLDQGWTEDQRMRFHHTAQGTRLLPYDWFMALEQPCFSLFGCDLLSDQIYLSRFGFLASKTDPALNPDGLPVGFAREEGFHDPDTGRDYAVVGLSCAACHTGELHWDKYAVRIEGAPAMIEIAQFQKALGLAMGFTEKLPFRYGRFERRLLGPDASSERKAVLKKTFEAYLGAALAENNAATEREVYQNQAGFARTDALSRIGNQVFGVDMKNYGNLAAANAPVRYPQIWDASWFTWVQYNSSISDPMVRNIGESMGVRAVAKLYGDHALDYENTVNVPSLKAIEDMLAGPAPYQGLSAPKWPAEFPPTDPKKVAEGAQLYKQHCQSCHLPPVRELLADLQSAQPVYWWKNGQGKRFLRVKDVKVDYIGTDPHEAMDFISRTADSGALNQGRIPAAKGLNLVTRMIAAKAFDKLGLSASERIRWSGFRDPADLAVRAEPIYKARPLNGIWAAAPYLHNGSVPNLYLLLSPQSERPDRFWLGSKQFDPIRVGHDTSPLKGGYLYDAHTGQGNSNAGHLFAEGPRGKGIIGPPLSPDERMAIIEYLKSL